MDRELYAILLKKTLESGDQLKNIKTGDNLAYIEHPLNWYGRLANPGCRPGLYRDRYNLIVNRNDNKFELPIEDIEYLDQKLLETRKQNLASEWFRIDYEVDCIDPRLPPTAFQEADTVQLIDTTHPNYVKEKDLIDPTTGVTHGKVPLHQLNQYTVYRVCYRDSFTWDDNSKRCIGNNPKYHLRAGKTKFFAYESQLKLLTRGPVKIFYTSENFDISWRSLKDEAEFYLLLGRFFKIFNEDKFTYLWNLAEAQTAVINNKADGILKIIEGYYLIKFWDRNIGDQIRCEPHLILDI